MLPRPPPPPPAPPSMPPPAPPSMPPPAPPSMNKIPATPLTIPNDRINLLADIRKGATLRKTQVNRNKEDAMLGQFDNQMPRLQNTVDADKQLTKNLLQAELCSTLKRRKPVAIVEPPKYQYPTYDNESHKDVVENCSAGDLSNANNGSYSNKPIKNVLSVITKAKIPDEIIDKINPNETQKSSENQTNNKPMIAHAKPNFTLPRKFNSNANKTNLTNGVIHNNYNNNVSNETNNGINRNGLKNGNTMKKVVVRDELKPKPLNIEKDVIDMKTEQLGKNTSSVTITINSPVPPPLPAKSITTKPINSSITSTISSANNSITSDIVQTTNGITKIQLKKVPSDSNADTKKMFISHGKPNFVVKTGDKATPVSPKETLNSKQQCENYLEVKIKSLKPQKSRDDSLTTTVNDKKIMVNQLNNSSEYSVATECNNSLKNAIKSLKSHKLVDEVDASPNLIFNSFAKNKTITSNGHGTLTRKVSNWNEQNINNLNHSSTLPFKKSINEHYSNNKVTQASVINGSTNFEQKSIVSFSKDLKDAPNHYPEKIKVTKTITTKSETTTVVQQSVFNNIKFVIGNDGQVLQNTQ